VESDKVARDDVMYPVSLRGEALQEAIQERIKQLILAQQLGAGAVIPPEGVLARNFGVSRTAVREAIKALQALGIVEIRHGQGTFVGNFSLDALVAGLTFRIRLASNQDWHTVRELLEIRELLECGLIARLPGIITSSHLAAMRGLVNHMEECAAQGKPFPEEDRAFHEVLYQPLENSLVIQLLQAFWEVYHIVSPELPIGKDHPRDIVAAHRQILDALEARDGDAAVAAMAAHFNGLKDRVAEQRRTP
jgi:DNA-binding FadR family transcriptional regulator